MKYLRPTARHLASAAFLFGVLSQTILAQQLEPPLTEQLNILYSDDDNVEVANQYLLYNTCVRSKVASDSPIPNYAYVGFVPIDATVNFYHDDNCEDFAFGLVGHYHEFPGPAKSIKWVGRDRDNIGVYFNTSLPLTSKYGFGEGDGDQQPAPTPNEGAPQTPSTQKPQPISQPTNPPQGPSDGSNNNDSDNNTADQPKENTFTSLLGSFIGSAIVLSIGGTIIWMTVGKKMVNSRAGGMDKGKGVLPSYIRARDDEDNFNNDEYIHLTASNRLRDHEEAFEIGDGDDIESDDDGDDIKHQNQGRQRLSPAQSRGGAPSPSTTPYRDAEPSDDDDVADDDSNDTQPLN
ncbi:hypothetical protein BGW41_005510 [Actinomortierella wolfii]|nr:hypothetical protein BGW41_005510 [Actinomortierella wolfii]